MLMTFLVMLLAVIVVTKIEDGVASVPSTTSTSMDDIIGVGGTVAPAYTLSHFRAKIFHQTQIKTSQNQ